MSLAGGSKGKKKDCASFLCANFILLRIKYSPGKPALDLLLNRDHVRAGTFRNRSFRKRRNTRPSEMMLLLKGFESRW